MKENWKLTWRDTGDVGLAEHMLGTKYLRWMANQVGAASPDTDWQWTKDLYRRCAAAFGRADHRTVERACRQAMMKAGLKTTTSELVVELAEIVWERREEQGVPDMEVQHDQS